MSRVQLVIVPNWNVCNFYKLSALFRANNRNLSVCEFSYGNEMPRSDDLREEKQREMANTSLTECLLFGRAVDRLYLRSGLSLSLSPGWELNAWMAKRKPRATLKMSASHNGVTAATRRRIYNRALFIFYWATFGLHTSRNSQETHAAHPRARILSTLGTSSIIPVDESWVKFEQTVFNDGAMHVRFWKATL